MIEVLTFLAAVFAVGLGLWNLYLYTSVIYDYDTCLHTLEEDTKALRLRTPPPPPRNVKKKGVG